MDFIKVYVHIRQGNNYLLYSFFLYCSCRQYDSTSAQSADSTEFWTLELERVVKKIRQDFHTFYSTLYRDMTTYYETKTEELEINIKESIENQKNEREQFIIIQEKLQIEYEKIQKTYNYEREILTQLESTFCKLKINHFSSFFSSHKINS